MDNLDNLQNKPASPQPGANPDPENQPAGAQPGANPEMDELQAEYESLRHLVFSLLVLLFIVSGTLSFFLYRELSYTRRELAAARAQIGPRIAEYNQAVPTIQNFVKQLNEYGRTHPDFGPIMDKYKLRANATTTGAPPAAPGKAAPATTPAQKAPAKK